MSDNMKQRGQPITYKGANFGHCGKTRIVVLTICPFIDEPFKIFNVFMPVSHARKLHRDLRDIFKELKQEKKRRQSMDPPLPADHELPAADARPLEADCCDRPDDEPMRGDDENG